MGGSPCRLQDWASSVQWAGAELVHSKQRPTQADCVAERPTCVLVDGEGAAAITSAPYPARRAWSLRKP
jgi:hypothetical protein